MERDIDADSKPSVFLSDDDGLTGRFIKLTQFIIYVIVLLIWAVIGFLMWVPLIFRMILIFTGSVIAEAISTDKNYTALLEKRLNYAIAFYPSTFNRIQDSIFGDPDMVHERPDMSGDLKVIIFELFWSTIFWGVLRYIIF